ncbi:hypothetical protein N9140_00905 [bacterium]|nr:hypothetical protein [bacterium]
MTFRGITHLVRSGTTRAFSTTSTYLPALSLLGHYHALSTTSTFIVQRRNNAFSATSINAFGATSTFMLGSAANNVYHRRGTFDGLNRLAALSATAAAAIASSSSNDTAAKCEHDEEEAESASQSVAKTNHNFSDVSTMDDIVDGTLAATCIEFTRPKLAGRSTSEEYVGSAMHLHNSCQTYKKGGDDNIRRIYNTTVNPLLLDAICRPHVVG